MLTSSKICKSDINRIVDIHTSSFPNFFLTSLGSQFLYVFYNACIKHNRCISIKVVGEDNSILGFAIGTSISKGFYKDLILSDFFNFCWISFLILLKCPKSIVRLLRNFNKNKIDLDQNDYSELLSIAVNESSKGKGIGDLLIISFEQELIKKGFSKVTLTTDYYNNERAINFYIKNGYKVYADFVSYPQRRMFKMIKILEKF